ncbi:hypothetical protein BB561_004895 [Smittium simulii]|uniref:Uncharacterized protein n=1 Tax=Smittium simulii TaxID=133385 RepID=A0A2T9YDJ6_9FUNG|nr:hypothetical protein BB561_004895 [Smittium simulii]
MPNRTVDLFTCSEKPDNTSLRFLASTLPLYYLQKTTLAAHSLLGPVNDSESPNRQRRNLKRKASKLIIEGKTKLRGSFIYFESTGNGCSTTSRQCIAEPDSVKRLTATADQPLIYSRSFRIRSFYRCKQHDMIDSCVIIIFFRAVGSIKDLSLHKQKRIISNNKSAIDTTSERFSNLSEQIWLQCLKTGTQLKLCIPYIPQPYRCVNQTNRADGMRHLRLIFNQIALRFANHDVDLFACKKNAQLGSLEQPILLPTVESDSTSNIKKSQRETNSNSNSNNISINI